MTIDEIMRYIEVGSTNSICVDRRILDDYQHIVRDVIIRKDCILTIEFNTFGYDEGGLIINIHYKDYKKLISSLESYLDINIENWTNINKSGWYPEQIKDVDFDESSEKFEKDLAGDKILLPMGGDKYEIQANIGTILLARIKMKIY